MDEAAVVVEAIAVGITIIAIIHIENSVAASEETIIIGTIARGETTIIGTEIDRATYKLMFLIV